MAISLTHYRIFLASPNDVAEERDLIESSITELNQTVCKSLNIYLDLVKWESHSYPSIGSYSQEVITNQINDYDFFIGIMWSKVGTPTPKFDSGTIEEFNNAYAKYIGGTDIRILFYFNNKPIPPSDIDPEQLKKLNTFKKDIQEKGAYHYTYSQPEEFQTLVRLHISNHLHELILYSNKKDSERKDFQEPNKSSQKGLYKQVSDSEELGLIEYIDIFKERFADAENSVERLGKFLTNLGINISKRGDKIESYKNLPFDTMKEVKKEIDRASGDILEYVKQTNLEVPVFHDHYYNGMDALSNALTIQEEDGMISEKDLEDLLNTLIDNHKIFTTTIYQIEEFKIIASKLPRISSSIKIAKRQIDRTLENLLSELKSTQNLSFEFSKRISSILKLNNRI